MSRASCSLRGRCAELVADPDFQPCSDCPNRANEWVCPCGGSRITGTDPKQSPSLAKSRCMACGRSIAAFVHASAPFRSGDVLRDADNYLGTFRHHDPKLGTFITVRAGDTGADVPRLAKPPLTLVASARPTCATCKHWASPGTKTFEGHELPPSKEQTGVCLLVTADAEDRSEEAFTQTVCCGGDWGDASSLLRTRPTFGCALHEPLSSEPHKDDVRGGPSAAGGGS